MVDVAIQHATQRLNDSCITIPDETVIEITDLILRNADTGQFLWKSLYKSDGHQVATRPINDFNIVQRVLVDDVASRPSFEIATDRKKSICLEEWAFRFGFVMPKSVNSWQSVVVSAETKDGDGKRETIDSLKGVDFVIDTLFYDGKTFLSKTCFRFRYVES
ncbi:hypothetical protein HJC23_012324 [Cyclotella cryptica]|uniref:GMP phosphodiesterase delta subunit domain-containing protein n=1 Tax=Cyclotella cryptica TaxID=29204 RepID=A0ABD3QCG1_9STRA